MLQEMKNKQTRRQQSYMDPDDRLESQGFSELIKDQWYFKVGRTTAITTGICHGAKVILRTPGTGEIIIDRTQYGKTGRSHKLSEPVGYVEEHIILNSSSGEGFHMQQIQRQKRLDEIGIFSEDFCQPGDSGALIIDSQGCAAELLFCQLFWLYRSLR